MSRRVSVIVPVLNEESTIEDLLTQKWTADADEVIVADGGSTDRTLALAGQYATVIHCQGGRGPQMNAGARVSSSDILFFLHADVRLQPSAIEAVRRAFEDPTVVGGCLDVVFTGGDWLSRLFTWGYHHRRIFRIIYGDSGIFCRRDIFEQMGGYKNIAIMEDYEFARRLWKLGKMALLDEPIYVSDRRWRKAGLVRTWMVWTLIQTLFSLGYPAQKLGRFYRVIR